MNHIMKEFANDPDLIVPKDPQSASFVRGLVERGEAIPAAEGRAALPPAVTHLIVGSTESGAPILKRVRFSGYGCRG